MIEKIKFMKDKEIKEDEMKPVLVIANVFIVPLILAGCFTLAQSQDLAGVLAFIIFAGLGYYDWRTGK